MGLKILRVGNCPLSHKCGSARVNGPILLMIWYDALGFIWVTGAEVSGVRDYKSPELPIDS